MSIKTTNARMQQLTGKWSDLNTDNLLVGEMAVPSDHNPVIKTGDNKIREIPLLEDMSEYETYIAQLRSAIDEANRLIDEVITKVGINDNEIGTTTTYSSSKIEERIGTIEPTAIINDTTASDKTVYSSNKVESKITETKNEIGESITTINDNITQITEDVSALNSNLSHVGMIIQSTTLDTMAKVIEIYGGTEWVKIEGRMLLGASSSYAVNSTGGSATSTLTTANLPSHSHSFSGSQSHKHAQSLGGKIEVHNPSPYAGNASKGNMISSGYGETTAYIQYTDNTTVTISGTTGATGSGTAVNNMPPYKAVYIWERTA